MRPVAVIWSSVLHIALLVAVIVGLPWQFERPRPAIVAAPIQGVIIDTAAIERERAKQEAAARQERLQQQREDRQRREAEQREQQRVAAERREREDAQRKEEERVADQQRKKQEAEAQARRDREETEKRAAEQRRRQQAESELQAQLAAEAEANAAREAGVLDEYMLKIEIHVKRFWHPPPNLRADLSCVVVVVQAQTGDVLSAKVDSSRCNGDEAVRRSIENAVLEATPLPRAPTPAVFSRTFTLTFVPPDK